MSTAKHEEPQRASIVSKIPKAWLSEPAPPQEWLWEKLIPMGCVTTMLAEGGGSKSFLALRIAEAAVRGHPSFFTASDAPLALRKGGVVYLSGEDPPEVIRRRLWAIVARKVETMRAKLSGKPLGEAIAAYKEDVRQRLHIANCVGRDVHLIDTTTGEVRQSDDVEHIIEDLRAVKELVLVVIDPLARFHGGEENGNAVNTALINAGERIAQEFGCAVVMLHHVSKAAASDGNQSAHAGRGGSALGDGARSVLRLLPATSKDVSGVELRRLNAAEPINLGEVEEGNVVRLHHAKSSYGPRQRDMFLLRDKDTGELLPLRVTTDARDPFNAGIDKLRAWLAQRGGAPVTRSLVKKSYAVIAPPMSRDDTEVLFEDAIARGVLVRDPSYRGRNPAAAGYVLAAAIPADTGEILAKNFASIPDEGREGSPTDTGEAPPSYTSPVYFAGIPPAQKTGSKKGYRRDTGEKTAGAAASRKSLNGAGAAHE